MSAIDEIFFLRICVYLALLSVSPSLSSFIYFSLAILLSSLSLSLRFI